MTTNTLSKITDTTTIQKYPEIVSFINSLYDALTGDIYLRDINLSTTQNQSAGSELYKWNINAVNSNAVVKYQIFSYTNITDTHTMIRDARVLIIANRGNTNPFRALFQFVYLTIFDTISITESATNINILVNGNQIATSVSDFGTSIDYNTNGFRVLYLT